MSTIQEIISSEFITGVSLPKINSNFENLNADKLEAPDIAGKQDTLVSWTNIKTINWVTVLGSGDLSIPTLTDWDKGDIKLTSSGTVWTIENNVVTNAKQATVATNTIKGRTTAGTWNVEDLTTTQVAWMLPVATTSVAGTMSASDKTKLDGLSTLVLNWTASITSFSYVQPSSWTFTNYSATITPTTGTVAYIYMTAATNAELWLQKYVGWTWVDMNSAITWGASLTFFPVLQAWVDFRFKVTTYATWANCSATCNITV